MAEVGQPAEKIENLTEELMRSGLLREVDGCVEFRHLLIQEYFAGTAISGFAEIETYISDDWWRRAIIFYFGSCPSNNNSLKQTLSIEKKESLPKNFNFAVALGLASQAAYFTKVPIKRDVFRKVVAILANCTSGVTEDVKMTECKHPISEFLFHFMDGKDSLANDCLVEDKRLLSFLEEDKPTAQFRWFWFITSLIETESFELALKYLKEKHVTCPRLLMCLHVCASQIVHVRTLDKEPRRSAKELIEFMIPEITPILPDFSKEFKSVILELQKGTITELPED